MNVPTAPPSIAAYGCWRSPISAKLIVAHTIGLSGPLIYGDSRVWLESRPTEGGRNVVVERRADGRIHDLSQAGFNVRSRVHEYGGGAWVLDHRGLWFVNDSDQRIYHQAGAGPPRALTPPGTMRYADLQLDPVHERLIAVREEHHPDGTEPSNTLVSLAIDGRDGAGQILAQGRDFYASARFSPDGRQLSWLTWNHPHMPWDETELTLAQVDENGSIQQSHHIAGGSGESIFQPQWTQYGQLYFVSDRSGWWNLYGWDGHRAQAQLPMEAEFGLPQWVFGMSTWAAAGHRRLVGTYTRNGRWHLGVLDTRNGDWHEPALPYTEYSELQAAGDRVVFRAASPLHAPALIELDLNTGTTQVLAQSMATTPHPGYLSQPQGIDYPSGPGGAEDETAHALYYPPCNRDFEAPPGERPPLLVRSHGGPTAAASSALNLGIQYWTSRGFALLDVNYGGSTGYGRQYRKRLDQRWGQTDVDDCVHGARYLIDRGLADPLRCAIRGSSAGGYTTLASLTFRDLFRAGASLYGISDLEALATDTHKFESRYLDRLIGPYPAERQRYHDRSPIHFTHQLNCPIIFLQGLQDKVVPPAQAQAMVDALRAKGLPVTYLTFADEQHGFRQAANIKAALEAELSFYGEVFGFAPTR